MVGPVLSAQMYRTSSSCIMMPRRSRRIASAVELLRYTSHRRGQASLRLMWPMQANFPSRTHTCISTLAYTCPTLAYTFLSASPTPLDATTPTWELMGDENDIPPSDPSRWEAYTAPCVAPEPAPREASDVSQPTSPHSGIGTRP